MPTGSFILQAYVADCTPHDCRGAGEAANFGAEAAAAEVSAGQLKEYLTYPEDWGPSEWGPIPFLPNPDVLVNRLERQWGDLRDYRGISTTAKGEDPFCIPLSKLTTTTCGPINMLHQDIQASPLLFMLHSSTARLSLSPHFSVLQPWKQIPSKSCAAVTSLATA